MALLNLMASRRAYTNNGPFIILRLTINIILSNCTLASANWILFLSRNFSLYCVSFSFCSSYSVMFILVRTGLVASFVLYRSLYFTDFSKSLTLVSESSSE